MALAKNRHLPRVAVMRAGSSGCAMLSNSASPAISAISPVRIQHRELETTADEVNHLMACSSALEGEVSKLHKKVFDCGSSVTFTPSIPSAGIGRFRRSANPARSAYAHHRANYGAAGYPAGVQRLLKAQHTRAILCGADQPRDIDLKPIWPWPMRRPGSGHSHRSEQRISNFLLWQSAYANSISPTRSGRPLTHGNGTGLAWYAQRERRFGQTSQQFRPSHTNVW